ncbi:MAG: flavodoxin domain-containing protein [Sphaerochaeta sp.]|jgi:menaquinone-dependent protoporphyrinogen oxidase|nr:flavodoxin domain-containing protein [Sphaerochaeta sp.]PKL27995.1 MAG: hypothetical protein CVV46_08410 [Spirochaetae bacterium HGW-Spirochaetae-2]
MKTLVVYASKGGYSRECAQKIAAGLTNGADVVDAKKDAFKTDIASYDTVILGGGILAGRLPGALRRYCLKNAFALEQKRIGLFICGTDPENHEKVFNSNYPAGLVEKAAVKKWFGGRILFADQKGIMRFVLKKMLKGENDVHAEQPEAVQAFVSAIEAI